MHCALRLRGLTKTFGTLRAVDGLDLDIPRVMTCGLIGPNRAGEDDVYPDDRTRAELDLQYRRQLPAAMQDDRDDVADRLGRPPASVAGAVHGAARRGGCLGDVWFAAKVFKVGLLMHGKPPDIKTLVRRARQARPA